MTVLANLPHRTAPEVEHLRLGFVPLTDCAPLVVAEMLDLGKTHGLKIELRRQPSWAAIRDKLLSGELDAAHSLYSLAYGVQLGLGGPQTDMAILMTLNRNGQAISVSNQLAQKLQQGQSLAASFAALGHKPVFAQTFPTGTHAMWLNYWLAANGIHPLHDVESVVIPPPQMAEALAQGELDGFCAGEPWHTVAQSMHAGRMLIPSAMVWPMHPEKALTCRREFVALYPNTARALIRTLLDACKWLENHENRHAAARWLAESQYLNLAPELILPSLVESGEQSVHSIASYFDEHGLNAPRPADGLWFLSQYRRWGMLRQQVEELDWQIIVNGVSQTALYNEAAGSMGLKDGDTRYSSSRLIDQVEWNGVDAKAYADHFAIRA